MGQKIEINVCINGEQITSNVPVRMNLVDFLRQNVGLTGSHVGCEHGVCGACTLLVDGKQIRGCLMLAVQADKCEVTTIEGLADSGRSAVLAKSFKKHHAVQCGFCTPGMIASALNYIESGGKPDRELIKIHLSGNYCRCTGYQSIVDAVLDAMEREQR